MSMYNFVTVTRPRRDVIHNEVSGSHTFKQPRVEVNVDDLPTDPGLRPKLCSYHPNDQDKVRRFYLQKGPCQPRTHDFPQRMFGTKSRRFCPSWFNEFESWLEYSINKDASYCLYCYLFKVDYGKQSGGDAFVTTGFSNWSVKGRLRDHVGVPNSAHNIAYRKGEDLMKQIQHIDVAILKQSDQVREIYRRRLSASLTCIRFLLKQGLPFRGHDESDASSNQGNFLELLKVLAACNEDIKKCVLQNAPDNHRLTAPKIQKDIVHAAATETIKAIINDLGNEYFSIIVDESKDVSIKEEMAIALRYVDKSGSIVEHFIGVVHVTDTSALTLKKGIDLVFSKYGLSVSRIRGQGYDGASNMQGEFNGLKSLILKENPSAFCIHCFAHQLQLTLVYVAKTHDHAALFFGLISTLINIVGGSCKRYDLLRETHAAKVKEGIAKGEIQTGRGMNQGIGLKRSGETRWGSHYGSLISLVQMYSSVIDVLEVIKEDGVTSDQKGEAMRHLDSIQTFDFAFFLHLMKTVLGITNELSQALQRKDQDILNAMQLVSIAKGRLQDMRDDGWDPLLEEVSAFCKVHDLDIPNMEDKFIPKGRSRRKAKDIKYWEHYRYDLFYTIVDMQLQELNYRFSESNTKLLLCLRCLSPDKSFEAFDKLKLIEFATFYPSDFSSVELVVLENQLETYILDMRSNDEFSELKGIACLAEMLVKTGKHRVYQLVYLLLKLALTLPVATAKVERAFSAMKIVKTELRNRMGDDWMNDCLVPYIESDVFDSIDDELIIQHFQNMQARRGQL
ncbi:unnamed protein product [Cuscuta epithymum]|uniref:TTF-type domain-containing protein n=1 Tax=Cuscuta epithymum TaxID=186058 RepID=A0AAV0ECS1_9ASTE|nr:unnamed protein product [Cuscuta epithymum]